MKELLDAYEKFVGQDALEELRRAAEPLQDKKLVHVNSTRQGGGVAEILNRMQPLMDALGVQTRWEVVEGERPFFEVTQAFHKGLQGDVCEITGEQLGVYREINRKSAEKLGPILEVADVVFVHDPQPAALLGLCPERRGVWIWRCHIDMGAPWPPVWQALRPLVAPYHASVYHLAAYAQPLPHPMAAIPPSIDPLSDKNVELADEDVEAVCEQFDLDPDRPLVVQVSRYDRFHDPLGVVEAYCLAKEEVDLQLVLVGGPAANHPEAEEVLQEVKHKVGDDPDVRLIMLPPDDHRTINALQRAADVVMQMSLREGFGFTVAEAMWKAKPVIGGNAGGIRLQIQDGETGYLVDSVEQAAGRIVDLLGDPSRAGQMGSRAQEHVRKHFLLTRHTKDYLELAAKLMKE